MDEKTKCCDKKPLPTIHSSKVVAKSRMFEIEELELEFSNGSKRLFQRLKGQGLGAVVIVPMVSNDEFLLIREYAVGLERYELSLPKGLIESEETPLIAASRELQEEVGYAPNQVELISTINSIPSYVSGEMHIILARDLYPQTLPGDEPEPLEVLTWRLSELQELVSRPDFTHAASIAALFMVREKFANET